MNHILSLQHSCALYVKVNVVHTSRKNCCVNLSFFFCPLLQITLKGATKKIRAETPPDTWPRPTNSLATLC